ncbi:MAG: SDR family NAD(P)-dependent oxidoreductase [Candidatus Heimdallarchaeota archaeon]|nr:SDR family NAD(P)-dependent oxidoreductase [Candidatus Heimdallarchaeota archaeon]MCK4953829.1 SDR family NAD(P)-dependent oxidoreductase [Candidatus Heimdallarchaeota archaeon]
MKRTKFIRRYGSWALIAGGSQGIGEAFARELARKGVNLVLIARREELLKKLADKLEKEYEIKVRILSIDLAEDNFIEEIRKITDDIQVNLLVYNAAIIPIGSYFKSDLEEQFRVINVNCRGPTILIDYFGRKMIEKGKGGIILISSMAGLQGTPINVHYAATKAYNIVLAEGLWYEMRNFGVDVIVSITGSTATPNYIATKPDNPGIFVPKPLKPSTVAKKSLANLGKKPRIIPGISNKIASFFVQKILSRKQAIKLIGRSTYNMYGRNE